MHNAGKGGYMALVEKGRGKYTFSEIQTQADSWEWVFKRIDEHAMDIKQAVSGTDEVVFTGCGSAFNISYAVAPFFQKYTGKTCRPVHSSDLMMNPDSFITGNKSTLIIGYSRSGNTTESVRALETGKYHGAETVAVVCFSKSSMAEKAHHSIVLEEAVEKSITTTRSLTSMVLAGNYLAGICAENDEICRDLKKLPVLARQKMNQFHDMGKSIGNDMTIKKFAFLGSGSYYGLAREAQLKVKEMVLLPADSYVSLDFQHGPMSNVDGHMLVTILASDAGRKYDIELAKNMKELGGKLLVICESSEEFDKYADYMLELNSGLGDGIRNILYMPVLQYMAYYRSIKEGNDPDNPKNLYYYVSLIT